MVVTHVLFRSSAVLALLSAFFVVYPLEGAPSGKGPLKVFLLAGQSNMEGLGRIEGDGPGTLRSLVRDAKSADRAKHLVDKDGQWIQRRDVWIWCLPHKNVDRKGNLAVGYGANSSHIGPEFGFGHVVGDHLDHQVLLIKIAWGGRSLAKDFRPPSSSGKVGPAYTDLVKHTRQVLENLKTHFPAYDGRGYKIAGFGWHQGWNDGCGWADTKEYEKNLANFIRDIRKEFGVKNLPFVIGNSGFAGWQQKVDRRLAIMKAQAAVSEHTEFKGNVVCVETRDFFRPREVSPSGQRYHWNHNAETYFLIGSAMGRAMVKLLEAKEPVP